ncbi:AAA family ATPase [Streptomyces marispadix]|uniref:ATP-binding protein n=1 Tax=Streptomyces marispadix TaxID=2922868 RepID=A0ABS9T280_9ACTN|nr:ATP-binding protein [Streptomyces marispadix]MCH6162617.1 ATP-binding protein [Streptomyces marispadix]
MQGREQVQLQFFHADRLANDAVRLRDPHRLIESVTKLCFACFFLARSGTYATPEVRRAALELAEKCSAGVRIPRFIRVGLRTRLEETKTDSADWLSFLGPGFDAAKVEDILKDAKIMGSRKDLFILPDHDRLEDIESAADLLAIAASAQQEQANRLSLSVAYDRSDSEARIKLVELFGIRGAPGSLKIPFLLKKEPVSSLIFGENGTGKSTIVDAVEFALQGRIGRSTLYDSPVSPALRSFSRDSGNWSMVELSDGTQVRREVVTNAGGAIAADPLTVRPGFRLAPITIRRADLLRFLDTGALSRGTILLDYFPASAETLAIRPDEAAHRLEATLTELRIRRTAYAERLAPLLGVHPADVDGREGFGKVVQKRVYKEQTPHSFQQNGGWERMDPELARVIRNLFQVHSEMRSIKKQIAAKDNLLNPVLHRDQVDLLKVALQGVGDEVTQAFTEICREHPVERIDILFGRSGPLSLDIRVGLIDGRSCFPQQIFSEAYRDLLALLFFTSVAKKAAEHGQARILILDDVLQSVDAGVRQDFVNHLLRNFQDWQLIFTVHDRLWMERLRSLFNVHEHRFVEHQIRSWHSFEGPILQPPGVDVLSKDLLLMLNHGEPDGIVGRAGPLLENLCRELCARFGLMVPYRRDGRHMLADLWSATESSLRNTRLEPQIRNLAADRSLRNLAAHSDPKVLQLSMNEALHFGRAVLDLYSEIRCPNCRRWVNEGKGCGSQSCISNIKL